MARNSAMPPSSVLITPTQWPDSLPMPQEEYFLSVVCGNTHIKWTLHYGSSNDFKPSVVWRTSHLDEEECNGVNPTVLLTRAVSSQTLMVIFGHTEGELTREAAVEHSLSRSAVLLTVYIVSTNDKQAGLVAWLFSEIPSRVYKMQPEDFFSTAQGRYDTMGIDRLVNAKALAHLTGFPALLIDGGTCMTYTAIDPLGVIRGGGIGLGVLAKLVAIAQNTMHAPGMTDVQSAQDMLNLTNDVVDTGKPLNVFARNTKEAVISTALREVALSCRYVIKKYLDEIASTSPTNEITDDDEDKEVETLRFNGMILKKGKGETPKVVVGGGDADILVKLLRPDHNGLIEQSPDIRPYEVCSLKNLESYGVAQALREHAIKHKEDPISEFDKLLLGCRIAKEFDHPDATGERIYRGTVTASIRDQKAATQEYLVLYDDVDTEALDLVELHAALLLYWKVGEKKTAKPFDDRVAQMIEEKKRGALSTAKKMEERSKVVKSNADRNLLNSEKAASGAPIVVPKPVPKTTPVTPSAPDNSGAKRKFKSPTASVQPKKKAKLDPLSFINARIAKQFEGDTFFGTVSGYDKSDKLWAINYDDGDEEEFDESDMKQYLALYQQHKDLDPRVK